MRKIYLRAEKKRQPSFAIFAAAAATLALALLFGCSREEPAEDAAARTPAPSPTATLQPTGTPVPDWYDAPVDFCGQDALLTAVQYALKTGDAQIPGSALARVEELILVSGAQIHDLSPLAHAERLRSLVILDGGMELSPLAQLPELTRLTLAGGHFGDLTRIAVLPRLQELNLFGYETTDFTPLAGLKQLHTLRLGNHMRYDYAGIRDLSGLTTLLLADGARTDLGWLGEMTQLESLTIWPCKQRDIPWISALKNLKSLHLNLRTNCDLSSLADLPELRRLAVNYESGRMFDTMWISRLTTVEELYLRGTYFGEPADFAGMERLRALTLDDVQIAVDLAELPAFPELASLTIKNCGVKNAQRLSGFPGLTRFALYGGSIDDCRAVYALTNLTALALRPRPAGGYASLGGVEQLELLVNLTELDWGGRAGRLETISNLPRLERLSLRGAKVRSLEDLTCLTELKTLDVSANGFSKIPDLSKLTKLTEFVMTDSRINDFSGLATLPGLTHATLQGDRIADASQLAESKRLYAVRLVDDVDNERQAEKLAAAQLAVDEALRRQTPYAGTADTEAVKNRFLLKDYLHRPSYGSAEWFSLLETTY